MPNVEQVECYQGAIRLDQYLAVAYFQQGVSNFLMGDFEEALANFNDTLLYLRGNTYIDYDQLGLKFKLYSCEVLFNRGLCYIYLQQENPGMQDFGFAQKEKMTPDHDVIDDAIREKAVGYTVFSIPVGVVYRPNEAKVKNLKTKDYLGKARLIATSNNQNLSTGFAGAEKKEALALQMAAKDDRPAENISFAATNLVQRNLSSRIARDQSAPPVMSRNVFPPTPPPEAEKPSIRNSSGSNPSSNATSLPLRTTSMRNPSRNVQPPPSRKVYNDPPRPGMLGRSATFDVNAKQPPSMGPPPSMARPPLNTALPRENSWSDEVPYTGSMIDRPRLGTQRTASEPRGPPTRSSPSQQYVSRNPSQRNPAPLFRETTPQRPNPSQHPIHKYNFMRDPAEDTVDNVFNMYSNSSPIDNQQQTMPLPRQPTQRRVRATPEPQPYMIDEEDEYIDESYISPEDLVTFEPVTLSPPYPKRSSSRTGHRHSKRPELKRVRIKVHSPDDTRYIMMNIAPSMGGNGGIDFGEFESKIREKFGVKSQLKIKMREVDDTSSGDEMPQGDMITMGDQDDLEMLLGAVRSVARRERSEMGKMQVWISY